MRLLVNASALVYNRYMIFSCDLSSKNAVQGLPACINSSPSEYPALTTRPRQVGLSALLIEAHARAIASRLG
jgi:hypothetical protein